MAKSNRKKTAKRAVRVRDMAPRKNPKGGTSNVLKTRHDSAKNAISNIK